jgi:hypothetical protein
MPPYVGDRGRIDSVSMRKAVQMPAQVRPFRQPAPYSEVRMIALRKHPAVAAGHDAELDPGRFGVRGAFEGAPRDVALERYAADDALAEPGRPRDDTVGPVGTDEEARTDEVRADACGHAGVTDLDVAHGDSVAELRPGGRRLLGKMEVEPSPLRHLDERIRALPRDLRPIPDADDHANDDVLHDWIDGAREMPERPSGKSAAARFVAREPRLVDEKNAHPGPLEVDCRRRSCRPSTDDENVEALHPAIVGRASSRGYNCAPPQGFPSGQRGRAVNPLAQPSEVRILPPAYPADGNSLARISIAQDP